LAPSSSIEEAEEEDARKEGSLDLSSSNVKMDVTIRPCANRPRIAALENKPTSSGFQKIATPKRQRAALR
jgi:hypothetical protein